MTYIFLLKTLLRSHLLQKSPQKPQLSDSLCIRLYRHITFTGVPFPARLQAAQGWVHVLLVSGVTAPSTTRVQKPLT